LNEMENPFVLCHTSLLQEYHKLCSFRLVILSSLPHPEKR
jgi:hypothetical protein